MDVFTIGFAKKPARRFFDLLRDARVARVVDVRLNNASQLAGFAKRDDLAWFLEEIAGIEYAHVPELAPTKEILDEYRAKKRDGGGDWGRYTRRFLELLEERRVEETIPRELLDGGCLLCSEHEPHHCHRRLVAEYLQRRWGDLQVIDLA